MPAFTIHGYELELSDCSRESELVQKQFRRSASARLRHTRLAVKQFFDCKTTWLDPSDSVFLRGLVSGEGDVWSFESDVYSSKGLAFSTTPARDTTNFKFGTASMTAASGSTYTAAWTDSTLRTVLYWRRPGSGSFNHYALVCTGNTVTSKYKNGSTTAETVTNWFTPASDGSFSLLGKNDAGTNTTVQYDDVVVLPGAAPAAAIAAWAARTEAWADLPNIRISGDLVDTTGASLEVIPEYKSSSYTMGISPVSGSFISNLEALKFSFRQV